MTRRLAEEESTRTAMPVCANSLRRDSEDTMRFSVLTGVRSMNDVFPLERAAEAYDRMMSGKARFRVVLNLAGAQ